MEVGCACLISHDKGSSVNTGLQIPLINKSRFLNEKEATGNIKNK